MIFFPSSPSSQYRARSMAKMLCFSHIHRMLSNEFWSWWAWAGMCVCVNACVSLRHVVCVLVYFGMLSEVLISHTHSQSICMLRASMALTIYRFLNQFPILLCIHVYAQTHTILAYTQTKKQTNKSYRVARCCNVDAIARSARNNCTI